MKQSQEKGLFKSASFLDRIIYWLERSCEQQNFLARRGVKTYFFFQPSPHIPQSKELTDHEQQMIKDLKNKLGTNYIQDIADIYLIVRKLIKKGNLSLNLIDFSQIFIDEPREIFVDGCCHLNQLGHSLLTQEIAKVIKETYSESEKIELCHDNFRSLFKKFHLKCNH